MVVAQSNLKRILALLRKRNRKIVFTNGCFDILHSGHIKYLESAKKRGDILIVGINSDLSVRKIKGESRPIFSQKDRAYILSALKAVDYVIIFNDRTPLKLIKTIKPDLLVKGGDWSINEIIGGKFVSSYGGKVVSAPYLMGYSTTGILERIYNGIKKTKT
jgi:rfaE bifunctional protein nucleotidyltransferase chain/domain